MTAAISSSNCVRGANYWSTHHSYASTSSKRIPWPAGSGASSTPENTTLCGESWLWRLQSSDSTLLNRLAQQVIATKLNLASGATASASVSRSLALQLPHIAMDILKLTRDPNVDMRDIGRLMARDQILTGKVLHLANSAAYPGGGTISSPARAMAHIGLDGLKQMLFAFAFKGSVFRSKDYQVEMHDIWTHSLACAVAADLVAKARKRPLHMAFVAGLLHDIGKPVALSTFIQLQRRDKSLQCDQEAVLSLVERIHAKLGGLIASRWGLPGDLKSAISNHHRSDAIRGQHTELVRTVAAGDAICRALGIGYALPANRPRTAPEEIRELHRLGIDAQTAAALCNTVEHKAEAIRNL